MVFQIGIFDWIDIPVCVMDKKLLYEAPLVDIFDLVPSCRILQLSGKGTESFGVNDTEYTDSDFV